EASLAGEAAVQAERQRGVGLKKGKKKRRRGGNGHGPKPVPHPRGQTTLFSAPAGSYFSAEPTANAANWPAPDLPLLPRRPRPPLAVSPRRRRRRPGVDDPALALAGVSYRDGHSRPLRSLHRAEEKRRYTHAARTASHTGRHPALDPR